MTELIFVNPGVKVNGQYYCYVLLSQQMLPAIKRVAERCLFTKQYVAEIGHFCVLWFPKVRYSAPDRWGGKWNHLSMTHRLTINCAKNYCNRTLIVKVIAENVVECFLGTRCMLLLLRFYVFFQNPKSRDFFTFFAVFRTFSRTTMCTGLARTAR